MHHNYLSVIYDVFPPNNMADKKNPHSGVLVNMWHQGYEDNCSISVSVLCDLNIIQVTFHATATPFFICTFFHVLYPRELVRYLLMLYCAGTAFSRKTRKMCLREFHNLESAFT